MMLRLAIVATVLAACASAAVASSPPSFKVDPISVTLPAGNTSALVSVANQSDQSIRFQVTGAAWRQSLGGKMQLQPTQSLVFFPTVFTVDAGQTKKIRVGVTSMAGNVEQTYRLTIQQLPPLEQVLAPSKGATVNTVFRISIPVFVEPRAPISSRYDITPPVVADGALAFQFVNDGNAHVQLDGVRVIGRNASGATVFDYRDRAWYVLAGGRRAWSFGVTRAQCQATRSVDISFSSEGLAPAQQPAKSFTTSNLNCAAATP